MVCSSKVGHAEQVVDAAQSGPKWRNNYCKGEEPIDDLKDEIAHVAMPDEDPVYGTDGPLVRIWKAASKV
jgi:uncharacterized protein YjlB